MAEAFGIAASAIQIADTALKFKKICSEIKHTSEDLHHLTEEVTALATTFGEVEQSSTCHPTASSPAWQQCTRLFKSSAEGMNQITVELEKTIRAHRVTGPIRIYLKKDELERCRDRLERTKGIMELALQAHSYAVLKQQNETILNEIRAVAMSLPSQTATLSITAGPDSTQRDIAANELKGDDAQTNSNQKVVRRSGRPASKKAAYSYNIHIPIWIFRTGFQILIDRSNKSWSLNIRSYHQVPENSRVFRLAYNRQWDDVRHLMDSGEASPWDVDPNGRTLLYCAAEQFNTNACAFLLDLGLDPLMRLGWVGNALTRFASQVRHHNYHYAAEHRSTYDTLSLLLSHSDLLLELDDLLSPWGAYFLNGFGRDCLSLLLNTGIPNYSSLCKASRAQLACTIETTDPEAVTLLLGPDMTLYQAFGVLQRGMSFVDHHSLLNSASKALGCQFASLDQDQSIVRKWEVVIQSIIEHESQCTNSFEWRSSLQTFLVEYYRTLAVNKQPQGFQTRPRNDFFTQTGRIWVSLLQRMGADLLRYGAVEEAFFSSRKSDTVHVDDWWLMKHPRPVVFNLRYLTYGPEACDWFLYVVPVANGFFPPYCTVEYEMAGRFWDWIENPELYEVPGTFIEDDVDDTCDAYDEEYPKFTVQAPTL